MTFVSWSGPNTLKVLLLGGGALKIRSRQTAYPCRSAEFIRHKNLTKDLHIPCQKSRLPAGYRLAVGPGCGGGAFHSLTLSYVLDGIATHNSTTGWHHDCFFNQQANAYEGCRGRRLCSSVVFAPDIVCIDLHNLVYRTEINGYADRKLEGSSPANSTEEGL